MQMKIVVWQKASPRSLERAATTDEISSVVQTHENDWCTELWIGMGGRGELCRSLGSHEFTSRGLAEASRAA